MDNDCDGEADEDRLDALPQDMIFNFDISASMSEENTYVDTAVTTSTWQDCIAPSAVNISTVFVSEWETGEPLLTGVQETGEEFRTNYSSRIPISGSSLENTLDAALYELCLLDQYDLPRDDSDEPFVHSACQLLDVEVVDAQRNDGTVELFKPLEYFLLYKEHWKETGERLYQNSPWRDDSDKTIIIIGDEPAQSRYAFVDQDLIGEMAYLAGVKISLYIRQEYFTTLIVPGAEGADLQGFALLTCREYDAHMDCIRGRNGKVFFLDDYRLAELAGAVNEEFVSPFCPRSEEE